MFRLFLSRGLARNLQVAVVLSLCATGRSADAHDAQAATLADAHQLRLTGHYDEAAAAYQQLAENQTIAAARGLAACRRAVGKTAEARSTLAETARQHPQAAPVFGDLAQLAWERGDYEAAQKHADRALELDKDQLVARWITAELHRAAGRLEEADVAYRWFVRHYNRAQRSMKNPADLRLVGKAAAEYARWNRNSNQFRFLVNQLYPDALKLDKNYWPARLEAGLLFLEKYNQPDAANEINAGLAINPNAADLHCARAMLALQNYDLDQAAKSLETALQINPRSVIALQLRADLLLANFRAHEAIEVLETAREANPADEETLGRLAAAYGAVDGLKNSAQDSRMNKLIGAAVERNKHCGQFFAALAGTLDRLRKFPDAARYYDEAHRRMPQLLYVRGQLGMMYMRLGEEAKATKLLNESFDADPFNIRVKNTLAVLDLLSSYAVLETEHFVLRFDRGNDELLARYAARYLEDEVYPQIVERLGYEPEGKSLFEIFSRSGRTSGHGWFSARMVGLPFVGTVGACAGKMVAMASPNDMPGKFNWARVLKHEFVHVVNLQQTDFNIPHWFTEALAVLNEDTPRPVDWTRLLARRAAADDLFNLDTINLGFIRPVKGGDWTLAYCQAEIYAEYALHAYGDDALAKLLAAYADNLTTRQALRKALGVEQEEFEAGYRKYVEKLIAEAQVPTAAATTPAFADLQKAVEENPDDPDLLAQLAYAYLQRDDKPTARKWAESALEKRAKQPLAAYVLARLHLSIGDTRTALDALQSALDEDSPHSKLLALLAALKLRGRDFAAAERLYLLGRKSFPHDVQWLKWLAAVYLKSQDDDKLAAALADLADLEFDNFTIRKKLARLAADKKDHAAATRWANQALHINVMDADVHALLAAAQAQAKQFDFAVEEYETALRLDTQRNDWRFALGQICSRAGKKEKAIAVLTDLLKRDPQYPGADVLLESLEP